MNRDESNRYNLAEVLLLLFVVTVFGIGVTGMVISTNSTEQSFARACIETQGNPVFNGRHWECLK